MGSVFSSTSVASSSEAEGLPHTKCVDNRGKEYHVGQLGGESSKQVSAAMAGVPPHEKFPVQADQGIFLFLSHTGKDGVKEELARPTWWVFEQKFNIKVFFDNASIPCGVLNEMALLEPAYQCTHAVVNAFQGPRP